MATKKKTTKATSTTGRTRKIGRNEDGTKVAPVKKKSTKSKATGRRKSEPKETGPLPLCRCGCGRQVNSPKRLFLQGHDARYKGQLLDLVTAPEKAKVQTRAELLERGYTKEDLTPAGWVVCEDTTKAEATKLINNRGWDDFLDARVAKAEAKETKKLTKKTPAKKK